MNKLSQEEDYELNAYQSGVNLIKKADYFKHKIYEHLMLEIEDEAFLKLRLGIYKDQFLLELKKSLPHFEKIVEKEFDENNYPIVKKNAILNEKAKFEDLVLLRTKRKGNSGSNNLEFKDFFIDEDKELSSKILKEFQSTKGKKLAILIYLLTNKNIITIERSGLSRLKFSEFILNKTISNSEAVNKHFESNTDKLNILETDNDFKHIKGKLEKLIC